MKFWQKIFVGSFLTSMILFFLCGIYMVVAGLDFTLEDEVKRSQYYQSIYARRIEKCLKQNEDRLGELLGELSEEMTGDDRYIQIIVDGKLEYDSFQCLPPKPRYSFTEDSEVYNPVYMKDIGDSRFLYVKSEMFFNNSKYELVMIKDLSDIYESCNLQMKIFFALWLLQGLITAIIMFFITKGMTAPIERLNRAVKLMAKESVPMCLEAEGEDEVSELTDNFNHMSEAILKNIDTYKQTIANITHEIKTPLTSIIGYAELLKNPKCDDTMRDLALNYILDEGKRLNSVIKKMISFSRVQPGTIDVERQGVDKLLEMALMAVKIKADEKQICFITEIAPGVYCYGDKELLITMLENVLDNAIKASEKGGEIKIEAESRENALYAICITDYGIGIPEHMLDKIEQPFFSGARDHSGDQDGFGMGLAICKMVMQHHHGFLHFESEEGVFTAVTMQFPCEDYLHLERERVEEQNTRRFYDMPDMMR